MGLELAEKPLEDKEIACTYQSVQTEAESTALLQCLQQEMPQSADVIVWAMQAISFGKWDGKGISLVNEDIQAEDILSLRLYNAQEELYLRREGKYMRGRHIVDQRGSGQHIIDSFSRLWGEVQEGADVPEGFTCLRDKARGLELVVPYEGPRARQLGLTTRNYIGYDAETGLAGYSDYRFVSIDVAEEG